MLCTRTEKRSVSTGYPLFERDRAKKGYGKVEIVTNTRNILPENQSMVQQEMVC